MTKRLGILELWVDPVTMEQAVAKVEEFVERGDRPHSIFAVNPEKNFSLPRNPVLRETFRMADLLIPDGIGVVLAARLLYRARLSRVPGVELMAEICRLAAARKYRIFIYGASEEVNREAAQILEKRHPGLSVAGRANGFLSGDQAEGLVERINESRAEILFLALGSPRQELWFAENRDKLTSVRVCQGVGGSLDAVTGRVKRAPAIFCRCNLEWFYRLISQPSRLKRQKVLPLFAFRVLGLKLGLLLRAGSPASYRPAGKPGPSYP